MQLGIEGVVRGQRRRTTVPEPAAPRPPDLVNRRFTAERPNQLWLADSQPGATKALQEICNAESRTHAEKAIEAFAKTYGAKVPMAVAKITEDRDELLAFYDFPAEHCRDIRSM